VSKYSSQEFDRKVIEASQQEQSATAAAASLGIRYVTYRRHAERLGVWKKNQSGIGISKRSDREISIQDILSGKFPSYQTSGVKRKLLQSGIKENRCEICGITHWNDKPIICELDHIDGNRNNHILSNLRMVCPNCHSQTETYRGKNKNGRVLEWQTVRT
jgi:5-methylcytosine-specific restriction endonuclease McrA